jgi:prepilin-type N-terminal cleavage/methylation domain-containing protein
MPRARKSGFTLVELLVAIGLATVLAVAFMMRPNDLGAAASLHAAENAAVSLLGAARLRAVASGQDVRLLVPLAERSMLVSQQQLEDGSWTTFGRHDLPPDSGVVPHPSRNVSAAASSTAFASGTVRASVGADPAVECESLVLSAHGTTGTSGVIVIAHFQNGKPTTAGVPRVITVSAYGIATSSAP